MISFRSAERNYELRNQPPEVPMGYLDTAEGQQWLRQAAEDLVEGRSQVWRSGLGKPRGVTVAMLTQRLCEVDGEGPWLAAEVVAAGWAQSEDYDAMATDYKRWAISVAMELLAPLADDYAEWLREEERLESELCD